VLPSLSFPWSAQRNDVDGNVADIGRLDILGTGTVIRFNQVVQLRFQFGSSDIVQSLNLTENYGLSPSDLLRPVGALLLMLQRFIAHDLFRPVSVPEDVRAALDRMCTPMDESWLSGTTAKEDARCMALIRNHVLAAPPANAQLHQQLADAKDGGTTQTHGRAIAVKEVV